MAILTSQEFRDTVLATYQAPANESTRSDLATQLDRALRGHVAQFWEQVILLEAWAMSPPTGDTVSIRQTLRGEFDRMVEEWQQSVLSRPRNAMVPTGTEFRNKVIGRYDVRCATSTPEDLSRLLEGGLAKRYVFFRELVFQLHLCAAQLAQDRDTDLGEQTKLDLRQVIELWKESVLSEPRAG